MRLYLAILALVPLAGCGSITRGTSEDVAISATPSIAEIKTSNGFNCKGSCTIRVKRKDEFSVTASAPGYQSETIEVTTKVSGGGAASMAGNVLAGGIIGIGVDAATGASLDHTPNPVVFVLEADGTPQVPAQVPEPSKKAKEPKGVPVS